MLVLMLCSQPCLTLSHPTLNSDVSALRDKLSDTKTALPLLQGPHSELVANRVGRQGTLASPGDSGFNDIS